MARGERPDSFWIAIGVGLIVVTTGFIAFLALMRPPETSDRTACRKDRVYPAHTIILVDQSDPFSPRDVEWVRTLLAEETRTLPKYGRVTLMMLVGDAPFEPLEVLYRCSPGNPDKALGILSNPEMIEQIWRQTLYEPLVHAGEKILKSPVQAQSPIAEALTGIMDRADFQKSISSRKLVLVSDLLQNSSTYSFYRQSATWDSYQNSASGEAIPDMHGVVVVARIVPRRHYNLPITRLKTFWSRYFEAAGAVFEPVN